MDRQDAPIKLMLRVDGREFDIEYSIERHVGEDPVFRMKYGGIQGTGKTEHECTVDMVDRLKQYIKTYHPFKG
jgi:hypothetical protein